MIELGSMSVRDDGSVVEARKKILGLARSLGATEVLATRAATALSELARRCRYTGDETVIHVSVSPEERGPRLRLEVHTAAPAVDAAPLKPCFDRVATSPHGPGGLITAELDIPAAGLILDHQLVERERARIASKSRAELLAELHQKNVQLEDHNERLEATVAARTADLQVANSRMQRDLDAGAAYVRAIIPEKIRQPVVIDWMYVPSSSLGGDTIGYYWIDDDHLAIYLVDVTGHGVDSALLAVTIANLLRSHSIPSVDMRRPDDVLAALNRDFQAERHGSKYFTIWYGVYQPSTRRLTFTAGGHHAAVLLVPGEHAPILLEGDGPMVGFTTDMDFPAQSRTIPPGARLLLFSDGVFEIVSKNVRVWTLEGAIEFMTRWSSSDQSLLKALLDHVQALRGSTQLDDDFSVIEAFFP